MRSAWNKGHVSHKKKTSQGNGGKGTFSINMNKHKKRSYKKYGARQMMTATLTQKEYATFKEK